MGAIVQARLDDETKAAMERLARRNGWSTSRTLREGIHALVRQSGEGAPVRIIGLGKFDSGVSDLGSNKKHLEGYGKRRAPTLKRKNSGR